MLIATLRDKGHCPCPRCLTTFDTVSELGTVQDIASRQTMIRTASVQDALVLNARKLIYKDGYVVTANRVENLLREQSLVPTRVCSLSPNLIRTINCSYRMHLRPDLAGSAWN